MSPKPAADQVTDPANAGPEPEVAEAPNLKDGGVDVAVPGYADGPITVTRPGVEAKTFEVKDGVVRASEEDRDWLVRHGVASAAE
jgi:hypothetical protein